MQRHLSCAVKLCQMILPGLAVQHGIASTLLSTDASSIPSPLLLLAMVTITMLKSATWCRNNGISLRSSRSIVPAISDSICDARTAKNIRRPSWHLYFSTRAAIHSPKSMISASLEIMSNIPSMSRLLSTSLERLHLLRNIIFVSS